MYTFCFQENHTIVRGFRDQSCVCLYGNGLFMSKIKKSGYSSDWKKFREKVELFIAHSKKCPGEFISQVTIKKFNSVVTLIY